MRVERNSSILLSVFVLSLPVFVLSSAAGAAPPPLTEPEDLALDEAPLTAATTPRARKEQMLERLKKARPAAAAKAQTTSKIVDCAKGDSLQKAIDGSVDGDTIEVRGLCNENVKIQRRKLTLHGLNPLTDGIRGVPSTSTVFAALEVWYTELVHLENLSFTHTSAGDAWKDAGVTGTISGCEHAP